MKKTIFILLVIIFCSEAQAQKKVALVNFSVNKEIGPGDFGTNAGLVSEITVLAANNNFDLQSVFDSFYKSFNDDFAKGFPFQLLPENDVLNNAENQAYDPKYDKAMYVLSKQGYKNLARPLLGMGKADKDAMASIFKTSADGVLMVFIGFELEKMAVMGVGVVKIKAFYNMICYDKEGKKVFDINEKGISKKSLPLVAGIPIMDKEKVQPMCEDAADQLLKELQGTLKKVVSKSAKKL